MRNSHRYSHSGLVLLLVGCGLLLSHSVALAGADAVKLLVKEPSSAVEFTVTEPALLGFMAFANLSQPLPEVPVVADGYEITRYWPNGPFDHFHYYPGSEGTPGYIYYDGFLQGWSESDGKWYRARLEADQAMRPLLAAHGLKRPSASRTLSVVWPIGMGVTVAVLALMVLGLRRSQPGRKVIRRPMR